MILPHLRSAEVDLILSHLGARRGSLRGVHPPHPAASAPSRVGLFAASDALWGYLCARTALRACHTGQPLWTRVHVAREAARPFSLG